MGAQVNGDTASGAWRLKIVKTEYMPDGLHSRAGRKRRAAATRPPKSRANETANCAARTCLKFSHIFLLGARRITPLVTILAGMARYFFRFFLGGGTVAACDSAQRVGKRTRLRRLIFAPSAIIVPSSSEKPIHLWLRLRTLTRPFDCRQCGLATTADGSPGSVRGRFKIRSDLPSRDRPLLAVSDRLRTSQNPTSVIRVSIDPKAIFQNSMSSNGSESGGGHLPR